MAEITLRNYQARAIHELFATWKAGYRSVVMVAPTGCGKRILALWLMDYGHKRRRKVLFVGNRRLLITQAQADADKFGIDYGIIMANAESGNAGSGNQIASIHTLKSWYFTGKYSSELTGEGLPDADLVIIDECFSGDTEILTPEGPKRIDLVRCGDSVYNATGVGTVNGTLKTTSRDIYTIRFTDGTSTTCTGNHPFFTGRGWIAARSMEVGEVTYGPEDMPNLWKGVHSSQAQGKDNARDGMEGSERLFEVLLKEVQEPNEQQGVSGEDAGETSRDQAQAYKAWWERELAPPSPASAPTCSGGGLGIRGSCDGGQGKGKWIPYLLQDRHRKRLQNDRNRAGRTQSRCPFQTRTGFQEGEGAGGVRVASISRHERKSTRTVFNISVTGHPSYFANGRLVHNCHQEPKKYRQLLELYPDSKFLCLTATPVGPEGRSLVPGLYDTLIEPVKNSELINNGFLLPTTVFAPSEPNIAGVTIDGGKEYSQKALGKAVQSCTVFADVFKEWEAYQDQATVCFVPGIAFGRHIVDEYNLRMGSAFPCGKAAYLIEAKTPQEERDEILKRVLGDQRGVIVSCDILREGFDLPVLSVAVDLQPNSQLRTYWQKIGRIKRPYEGQRNATYLDFAGNCWKFPHPDEDPVWPTGEFTTQDVIERRRVDKEEPKPIVCLKCGMMRKAGPVCPNCGHGGADSVRKVRMGDGSLVEIPFETKKRQEISEAQRAYNAWKGCLYGALAKGWTYAQCSRIYKAKTGQWPPSDWPGVYHNTSLDARRRPRDEFSKGELYQWLGEKSPV